MNRSKSILGWQTIGITGQEIPGREVLWTKDTIMQAEGGKEKKKMNQQRKKSCHLQYEQSVYKNKKLQESSKYNLSMAWPGESCLPLPLPPLPVCGDLALINPMFFKIWGHAIQPYRVIDTQNFSSCCQLSIQSGLSHSSPWYNTTHVHEILLYVYLLITWVLKKILSCYHHDYKTSKEINMNSMCIKRSVKAQDSRITPNCIKP